MEKGKLYIVATPIGNLGDITYRAVDILKSVPFVLAEDTRESIKLLRKYDINTQLISYRDQNHERMILKIKEKLDMGLNLALVSDCGTPLISDPGFKLVRDLREDGYLVESIPGPSAVISALSISGLPVERFTFLGFLPKSEKKRKEILKRYIELGDTVVIYESPKRLLKLLRVVENICKECELVVARDLTKKREEILSGSVQSVFSTFLERGFESNPHGEFVVMISSRNQKE